MNHKKQRQLKHNEQGIVSIILTVFVLIVLSLVVLAFSQNARREQRQSLDRQLSAQAFYAAESGVNELISGIRGGDITAKEETNCDNSSAKILDNNIAQKGQNAFSVSCALFDKAPEDLKFSVIDPQEGKFFSLRTTGSGEFGLNRLTLSWTKAEGGSGNYSSCGSVADGVSTAAAFSSCDAGIMRVLLIPTSNTGGVDRERLYNESFTVFLRPTSNGTEAGSEVGYKKHSDGADTQGKIVPAICTANGRCKATIFGLPSGGNVFMQVRSIYHSNSLDVTGQGTAGQPVEFDNAQVKIDVTGKASDVLRRVQVRMPVKEDYTQSASVLDIMQGVCKRLGVNPSEPASNSDCVTSGNGLD